MDSSLKAQHEAFVQGLEGGTVSSILPSVILPSCMYTVALSAALFSNLCRHYLSSSASSSTSSASFKRSMSLMQSSVELLSQLLPLSFLLLPDSHPLQSRFNQFSSTLYDVFPSWVGSFNEAGSVVFSLSILLLALILPLLFILLHLLSSLSSSSLHSELSTRSHSLTFFNATTILLTSYCILAVDFPAFSRSYAKRETYGFSLMDVGVGVFVLKSGFLSPCARSVLQNTSETTKKIEKGRGRDSTQRVNWRNVWTLLALAVLAVGRLLTVKAVNYQEHVAEYGVHWNFFCTLFFIRLVGMFLPRTPAMVGATGVIILASHEWFLSHGLGEYMATQERGNSFVEMNKEGIFSVLAYCAIYCLGCLGGSVFFQATQQILKSKGVDLDRSGCREAKMSLSALLVWVMVNIVGWTVLEFLSQAFGSPSRRLVNIPYVNAVVVSFSSALCLCALVERFLLSVGARGMPSLPVAEFISANSLYVFLCANLLTGATNLSINTFAMSWLATLGIMSTYICAAVGLSYVSHSLILLLFKLNESQ